MLYEAGFIPAAIFPGGNPAEVLRDADLLVLTGGGDPDPSLFGKKDQGSREPERERPLWELELYREAGRKSIPVLGICMGMQIIAIAEGVSLIQDLDTAGLNHVPHESIDRKPVIHMVDVVKGTLLSQALKSGEKVSSCHHQVIEKVPEGFMAAAFAPDGLIEAIESSDSLVTGVQWHPERDGTGHGILEYMKTIAGRK